MEVLFKAEEIFFFFLEEGCVIFRTLMESLLGQRWRGKSEDEGWNLQKSCVEIITPSIVK